jgi:hypothetical protein
MSKVPARAMAMVKVRFKKQQFFPEVINIEIR